jgi:hypothetical protein
MEALIIAATRQTPSVKFDPTDRHLRITGVSIPENASEFYLPVIDWLKNNGADLENGTTVSFSLTYFNSSSLKALYLVLMELKKLLDAGKSFDVFWYVEEEDEFMSEAAETFTEMVGIPLKLVTGSLED